MEQKIDEILKTVQSISKQLSEIQKQSSSQVDERSFDDLYTEAERLVLKARKASTSYLQRSLGIGYARAGSLIDRLEKNKVIGPGLGAKPRKVLRK